jgi:hypothetical protein
VNVGNPARTGIWVLAKVVKALKDAGTDPEPFLREALPWAYANGADLERLPSLEAALLAAERFVTLDPSWPPPSSSRRRSSSSRVPVASPPASNSSPSSASTS